MINRRFAPERSRNSMAEMNRQKVNAMKAKQKKETLARNTPSKAPLTYEQSVEKFMHQNGVQEATFGMLEYNYKNILAQMGPEVHKQSERVAQEIAKSSNVPYTKAFTFVQWANWEIYRREMQKKAGEQKP